MAERANKTVRRALGTRLRALRKQRELSQERLGHKSELSGKFIGEVERGEKSISIDSLARVSEALEVPMRELADVPVNGAKPIPKDVEELLALVRMNGAKLARRGAAPVLRALLGRVA